LRITVIIPTFDEAENLPKMVSALFALPLDLRLLVVDDGSPDGTGQVADQLASEHPGRMKVLHRSGKLGLRTAYFEGFQIALADGAEAIAQMDADFSHDPKVLPTMVDRLENCDVVFGSRYVQGGRLDDNWSAWRKGLSAWANFYTRMILGLPLRDITTGYRLWNAEIIRKIPLQRIKSNGYIFLVEMAYVAYCLGVRFAEVPIYFADRRWGKSKMSFKIQAEAAVRVWLVWWAYRDLRAGKRAALHHESNLL
jgi:dolichol-phosphate mannosyltransferase